MKPRKQADRFVDDGTPLGRWGEQLVVDLLAERGWTLVARNLRVAGVELDVVLRRRWLACVVEVKTCRAPLLPEETLSETQRWRLLRACAELPRALSTRPRRVELVLAAVRVAPDGRAEVRFFAIPPAGPEPS